MMGLSLVTAHMQRSEDSSMELVLSFPFLGGFRDQTPVTRPEQQALLSDKSHYAAQADLELTL